MASGIVEIPAVVLVSRRSLFLFTPEHASGCCNTTLMWRWWCILDSDVPSWFRAMVRGRHLQDVELPSFVRHALSFGPGNYICMEVEYFRHWGQVESGLDWGRHGNPRGPTSQVQAFYWWFWDLLDLPLCAVNTFPCLGDSRQEYVRCTCVYVSVSTQTWK